MRFSYEALKFLTFVLESSIENIMIMMIGKVLLNFKSSKRIYYSYYVGFNVNKIIVLLLYWF